MRKTRLIDFYRPTTSNEHPNRIGDLPVQTLHAPRLRCAAGIMNLAALDPSQSAWDSRRTEARRNSLVPERV